MKPHTLNIKAVSLAAGLTILAGNAQAQLTDGLLNYWPMEGDAADTASDYDNVASTTEDDGIVNGTVTFTESLSGFGNAANFPGGDGNDIRVPDGAASADGGVADDVDRTASNMSLSIWFKAASWTAGWQGIIAHGEGQDYRIARQSTSDPVVFAGVAGTTDMLTASTYEAATPATEQWHHIVMTATEGGEAQFYVDGILEKTSAGLNDPTVSISNSTAGTTNNNNALSIGSNLDRTGRAFNGLIDEVAMWDRALSAEEVTAIHNAGNNGLSLASLLNSDDSDLDGLPDAWENSFGLDPEDATGDNGASGDPDMDTLSNLEEYNGGVESTNPLSDDTDGDTIRDDYETGTGTFVSATNTGTNPKIKDTDEDGLDDNLEDNGGTFVSATQTGSNPNIVDTDSDTIPDNYEVVNLLDPNVDDTLLDPDMDTVNNLAEFSAGTDPQKPDTDDDFSDDNVEATNMTDPLNPDTDGDGLLDGYETNSGLFVSETDTGTDPLLPDTDLDGFSDSAEIIAETDPTDNASFPAASALPIADDFEDNVLDGATWKTITGTVSQNATGTILGGAISEEEGNLAFDARGYLYTATEFDPEVVGGLEISGELTFLTAQDVVSILTRCDASPVTRYGEANSGIQFVLNANKDNVGITARNGDHSIENVVVVNDNAINFVANVVYTFKVVDDGEGALSLVVTDKDTPENTISVTAEVTNDTSDFNHVVIHNREGNRSSNLHQIEIKSHLGPVQNEIQNITYDEDNGQFTLTWNSRLGTNYSLFASLDLTDFGNEVTDGIEGGDGTTTHTFDHPAPGSEKLFFRVEALPTQ